MEKRRELIETRKIEMKFLNCISNLGLSGRKYGHRLIVRKTFLKLSINFNLSGEEWDDNYNDEDG